MRGETKVMRDEMRRSFGLRPTSYLLIGILLIVTVLSGCGGSNNSGNASGTSNGGESNAATNSGNKDTDKSDSKPEVITIGAERGSSYTEYYKGITDQFTEKTGIKVEWIEVPHSDVHSKFLTDAISGSGAIDVYTYDQPWMFEFAELGMLEPLTDRISKEDLDDFYPAAKRSGSYKDEIYGLPFIVHTPIVYYRTDLFAKAGITKAPETWDEYREYAKKLTDKTSGVYGTIVEGKQQVEPTTHVLDRILQAGGVILDDQGQVVFDSPEVLDAFNWMLGVQYEDQSSPPGAVGYDNADVHNMFVQGKVAMVNGWPYVYSMASDKSLSKIVDNFDIAVQPAGKEKASAVWGLGYSISSSSKKKDAAWEFVKWATSSEVVQAMGSKFINPVPRQSALEAIRKDTNLTEKQIKALETMSKSLEYTKPVTEDTKFQAIDDRLAVALSKILSKQSKPEDEIKAAAADMKKILEE